MTTMLGLDLTGRRVLVVGGGPVAARRVQALVAAFLVIVWHGRIGRRDPQILVFDALGLGLFCVSGTIIASDAGLAPWAAALMGVITSIGGGVLRDVLAGRIPVVLQRDLYATPAALGAVVAAVTRNGVWDPKTIWSARIVSRHRSSVRSHTANEQSTSSRGCCGARFNAS